MTEVVIKPLVITAIGDQVSTEGDTVQFDVVFDLNGYSYIGCTSTGESVDGINFSVVSAGPLYVTARFSGTIAEDTHLISPYNMEVSLETDYSTVPPESPIITDSWLWQIDMSTVSEAIHTVLNAYAGLQALVGNGDSPETYRIYNMVIPQNASMPCIVTQKLGQQRVNTIADSGGSGVENQRVRMTVYADTIAEAEAVQEQLRLAMKAATTLKAIPVFGLDQFDNDTKLYQVIVDYSVWLRH